MPATLSWLDHSDYERRKAIEVIKLFEERGTVDELGIGTVRDAISDLLFPGTSVLQPRARYFLIIPWIYQYLEAKRVPSAEFKDKAQRLETDLIQQILASDDAQRAIGRIAGKKLKILPSTMYWSGLGAWGIRLYPGTQSEYYRWLARYYRAMNGIVRTEDGERVSDGLQPAWARTLPRPPADFPRAPLSLRLTRDEALYLQERILARCGGSLLAHLVDRCRPTEHAEFVWEHPDYEGFPARLKAQLEHARNLSEIIHGAVLLYNMMLALKAKREDWIHNHREAWQGWCRQTTDRSSAHLAWDRNDFWGSVYKVNPRITLSTRGFVETWLDLTVKHRPEDLLELRSARRLIEERELRLKGRLARLHNDLALKNWGGASGVGRLSYRWNPQVRQVTADIQRGVHARA